MKEIFLYSGVYDWNVQEILEQMSEIGETEDITYRVNSGGGSVFSAQGWLASMKKRSGKNIQAMEGNASSMAFFSALYMDKVTALETTKALVHRADMWVYSEEERNMLAGVNETFKELMKQRIDVAAFEKRAGMTIDEFFNPGAKNEIRNELWLSSQDLIAIGLVKEEDVLKLTPEIEASFKANAIAFGEYREPSASIIPEAKTNSNLQEVNSQEANSNSQENLININNTMELTAVEAVAQERERVAAWNVWAKIDPDKVLAGIASGKTISAVESQEFMLASTNLTNLEEIQKNSPKSVTTAKEVTAEELKVQKAEEEKAALFAEMGLKGDVK